MYELHRLLGALLSNELTTDEKLDIIGSEYNIPVEEELRKDVSVMCNLSQGVKEAAFAEGLAEGLATGEKAAEEKMMLNMHKKGFTLEQIAAATDKEIEEVKAVIKGKEPTFA